jgi:catechol 2,3-dioxygenase-like lactoylglutathione lyase family enzyme
MIGSLHAVVIDCPDPEALAEFYRAVVGGERVHASDGWCSLACPDGTTLSFQAVEDHQPPKWPDPAFPQQFHIDVMVDDLDVAQSEILALGATLLAGSDKPIGYRVYADPAGHPFCLTTT